MSENCLTLNIWTGARSARDRLPVLVWIAGGGWVSGAGSDPGYDGSGLASRGLIVVTMNYRLGVLGYLAASDLSRESSHHVSGNYGLLDQIACLQWVRKNISAFGGDPSRITIAGQSAGAESVNLLLISPLARGLFQRAVAESGPRSPFDPGFRGHPVYWRSSLQAQAAGAEFIKEQGVHSLKALRRIPWRRLKIKASLLAEFHPYFDGWVLPRRGFEETYEKGRQNDVPLMMGFNRDEVLGPAERMAAPTLRGFQSFARTLMGSLAPELLKLYPARSNRQAVRTHMEVVRDAHRVSLFLLASEWKKTAREPVFTYFWTHAPPALGHEPRGAYHGSEINYFFDNLYVRDLPWSNEDRTIAHIMSSYLVDFVTAGDPNGAGLPRWPEFRDSSRSTMELGDEFGPIPVAGKRKFALLKCYFLAHRPQ